MKGEKVFVVSAFLGLLVVPVRAGNLEESKASFTLVSEAGQPVMVSRSVSKNTGVRMLMRRFPN